MPRRSVRRAPAAPVPDPTESWLRTLGLLLICAKVALVPLVFDPSSDLPFVVIKAVVSHGLAYALASVLVALVIQSGWSVFGRSWLHVFVLGFLAVAVAATVFAADTLVALFGEHGRMVGLTTIADCVVLYFGIVALVRTRQEGIAVVASGLGASALVLAYAFAQFAGRDFFNWSVNSAVRPFSTIGQTTNLAEYLTVVAVGAAAFGLFDSKLPRWLRIVLILYSGAALMGVLVTQTRSAFLGLVAGAAALLLLTWVAYPDRRARLISSIATAVVTLALGGLLVLTPLGARLLTTVQFTPAAGTDDAPDPRLEESADTRLALYRIALEMVRERPLLGYGPDAFAVGMPKYRTASEPFEVQSGLTTSAHSWVAQTAIGTGLLGLLLFIAVTLAGYVMTLRGGFRPAAWAGAGMLAAYLGAGLTTVNAVSTDWIFWSSLGAISAALIPSKAAAVDSHVVSGHGRQRFKGGRGRMTTRGLVGLACAGLGIVIALTTFPSLDASHLNLASRQSRLAGRAQPALELGLRATSADSQRSEYWRTLGFAYIALDNPKQAVSAFEHATKFRPYDVRYLGDLARGLVLLARTGDSAAASRARDAGDLAVGIDPNNPESHVTRAVAMQGTGNLPEALTSINRALELAPFTTAAEVYRTAAQVLLGLGRKQEAIAMARNGVGILGNPPDSAQLRVELARGLAASGQLSEALIEIDKALAVIPTDSVALQLRAQIRASMPPQ